MYDINTEKIKKIRKFYFIFFAGGVLFLIAIGSFLIFNYSTLNSLDSKTMSTKVEVDSYTDTDGSTLYSPTYYYIIDGQEYSCDANSSSSINPGTSNKQVYYDSKAPSNCMTEYSKSSNIILLLFLLIPLAIIGIAVTNIIKISKRLRLINKLNMNGKLIKNLPYHLDNTKIYVNDKPIQQIVVEYTSPSGDVITLYGGPRHDGKSSVNDGLVDLVIDETNPKNYFIDFEINRLTGNLPMDYYNDTNMNDGNINNI